MSGQYGREAGPPYLGHTLDIIGQVETSAAGNLVLRIGSVNEDGSWTQDKHVVLTPAEWTAFLTEASEKMDQAALRIKA